MHLLFLLVAGVGFEPHDLRVMSPTSYQAALPRDIKFFPVGAGDRGRTGTILSYHGILSPGRLPVPPHRQAFHGLFRFLSVSVCYYTTLFLSCQAIWEKSFFFLSFSLHFFRRPFLYYSILATLLLFLFSIFFLTRTKIIHPHSGWYFSFGHSPNTTGYAQVRLLLACQPCICYETPLKRN